MILQLTRSMIELLRQKRIIKHVGESAHVHSSNKVVNVHNSVLYGALYLLLGKDTSLCDNDQLNKSRQLQ